MLSTRRRFLLGSSTLTLLSGCTQLTDPSANIAELEVVLVNGKSETLTFRFALETADGVGEWYSHEVESEEHTFVVVEPPETDDVVAIRGSVAEHSVRAELLEYGSETVCPKIYIEFELADDPTILQSANASC